MNNLFYSLIHYLPHAIFWKNKNLVFQGCNKEFAQQFGYSDPIEIIGKSDKDFSFPPDLIKRYHADDKKILKTGKPKLNYEEQQRQPDGSFKTVLISKVPFYDDKKQIIGILGIYTDITERKSKEKELKLAKKAAEAANQAKTAFIANMSHDIRTPLTGVIGISDILENLNTNPEIKQYAHHIHGCGEQLLHMLNSILDIISTENLNENDVINDLFDLKQCIYDLVELERPTTTMHHLELNIQWDDKLPQYIISDRTKIHRIILNLIGNAIKFTPEGSVTVEVNLVKKEKNNATIHFAVTDTGIGIPLAQQHKVFDRFFRASPSHKGKYSGYGVGLHIAQSYAKLLGSEIKLLSHEGTGTSFYFNLRCKIDNPKPHQASKKKSTHHVSLPSQHILLIEDNPIALKVLEALIATTNMTYIAVLDGESALKQAMQSSFDWIITDIGLPGISGIEFTKKLRSWEITQHKPPTPIIGLTAHAQADVKEECMHAGMNDVFTKPLTLDILEKLSIQFKSNPKKSIHKLGPDLPNSEGELFQLDNFPLLDINRALKCLGNNQDMLTDILTTMLKEEIPSEKTALTAAYSQTAWETIEKTAHKMKGGAMYCGTVKLQYACQYLERYRKAGHTKYLDKLYAQLLQVIIQTETAIQEWLSN